MAVKINCSISLLILSLVTLLFPSGLYSTSNSADISCYFDQNSEPYYYGENFMICVNLLPVLVKENIYVCLLYTSPSPRD